MNFRFFINSTTLRICSTNTTFSLSRKNMAPNLSSPSLSTMSIAISTLLFLSFVSSSFASDMSIISYNNPERSDAEVMGMFQSWLAKHGKAYNGIGENEKRFEIFKDNLRFIDEHNSETRTYKVGLNRFADLTNEEYRAKFLGTRTDPKRRVMKSKNPSQRYAFKAGEKLPSSVDWRVKGAVSPIKDQGNCGKYILTLSLLFFFICSYIL